MLASSPTPAICSPIPVDVRLRRATVDRIVWRHAIEGWASSTNAGRGRAILEDIDRTWQWRWCDQTFPDHDTIPSVAELRHYVGVARSAAAVLATDWIADHGRHWHLSVCLSDELLATLGGVQLNDPAAFSDDGAIRRFEHETFTAVRWLTPEHLRDYRPDEFAQRITATCWAAMLALTKTKPIPIRPSGRIRQIDPVLDAVDAWASEGRTVSPAVRLDGIPRFRGVGFPSPKKIVYGNLSAEGQPKPIAVLRAILEASDQLRTESFEEREIQRKAAVEGKLHTHLSKVRGLLKAVNYPETVQQHTDGEVMTYIYLTPDPPKRIE